MTIELKKVPAQIDAYIPEAVKEIPWPRVVAAGSLLVGAYLLFTGRYKGAVAAALGAAGVASLEKPELAKELWENTPKYLHSGQEFLRRAESILEDVKSKGEKMRELLS
jgi:hypothetical protein